MRVQIRFLALNLQIKLKRTGNNHHLKHIFMAIKVSQENFDSLLKGDKPLVLDFWATWCGPCRKIGPDIEALAEEYADKVNVAKCDVEENEDIATQYGVRNIPTVLFIKNGEVVDKQVGAAPKSVFEEKLKALL